MRSQINGRKIRRITQRAAAVDLPNELPDKIATREKQSGKKRKNKNTSLWDKKARFDASNHSLSHELGGE